MKRFRVGQSLKPAGEPDRTGDKRLDRAIARVLASGLALSIALLLVGVVMILAGRSSSAGLTSVADMPRAIAALEPSGFFFLGLLVLLLTPVARVIALAGAFARRKAWLFSLISLFVLAILGLSAFLGLRG